MWNKPMSLWTLKDVFKLYFWMIVIAIAGVLGLEMFDKAKEKIDERHEEN